MTDYSALLPGVPSIESPFFEPLFAQVDAVTRQIARNLRTYGCALIRYPKQGFADLMCPASNRQTSDYLASDMQHLVHSLHNRKLQQGGHVWVRGEGAYLYDSDGKRFIDALAGLWNVTAGHGRRELIEAATAQMSQLAYCSSYAGSTHVPAILLAEELGGDYAGWTCDRVME